MVKDGSSATVRTVQVHLMQLHAFIFGAHLFDLWCHVKIENYGFIG